MSNFQAQLPRNRFNAAPFAVEKRFAAASAHPRKRSSFVDKMQLLRPGKTQLLLQLFDAAFLQLPKIQILGVVWCATAAENVCLRTYVRILYTVHCIHI